MRTENQEAFEGKRLGPVKNKAAMKWVAVLLRNLGGGGVEEGSCSIDGPPYVYPDSGFLFSYFSSVPPVHELQKYPILPEGKPRPFCLDLYYSSYVLR
jgi:hypothetical protein